MARRVPPIEQRDRIGVGGGGGTNPDDDADADSGSADTGPGKVVPLADISSLKYLKTMADQAFFPGRGPEE
ncbi:unnamed protein product [Diplocarpon coronariae]|nr:hypothetical protein JHW43_006040 [Diplocarpon mali]